MQHRWSYGVVLAAVLLGTAARAAGIDCSKARSPTEKAICANPNLLALDQQIAAAYADSLQRQPDRKDAMRQDLVRWLKQRDAACALPSADIPRCLAGQMTARLAALAPPAPAAPVAAAPPPAGTLQTAGAPGRPADPAVPQGLTPPGAATLGQASAPAAEHGETLLHVTSAGRFTIAAKSPSGAALQLVDVMTGPSDVAGAPGSQDGRIDALLDAGTYKVRVMSAKGATGAVALTVTPFRDAAPPAALPQPGFPLAATLQDGEQRAFWLLVPPDGAVRIEAAGRALADLRLWRDGRDLAALAPAALRVEPASGHPLTDLRLDGKVEPGTYLAVVYGGAPMPWTDGDAAQPLFVRGGASPALAEGWAGGPMGPFGSEVYALPPGIGLMRLSLPASAPAELRADGAIAAIARNSREPTARLAVDPKKMPVVEVRAVAGQEFTLQALEQPPARVLRRPGTYWVSAVVNGAGGDEAPPTMLLERNEGADKPARIVASTVPRVGAGAAWHARFNLRGPTMVLVQNTAGGALAVRTSGVAISQHGQPGIANLPADYYGLTLTPDAGAIGSLDLVVGPPGAAPPPLAALPPDPVMPLGVQTIGPGQALRLSGPSAPGLQFGLSARLLPVALAEGPLTVTQAAGTGVSVPVMVAAGGTLAVSEVGGGPVAFGLQDAGAGASTVVVPIADHARSIVLAWRRTVVAAPIPAPPALGAVAAVTAGSPVFFDLAQDEHRGFAVTVPEGGLYRVETLGRLHTAGRIATAFIPRLGEAEANGVGDNMLLQESLRAGRYIVDVTALQSAGHLGLSVTPAPVLTGATLAPGGSVRASLPAGSAIRFPLVVAGPGEAFHLEVASLGAPWQGRIEDAQGWPLTRTGPLDDTAPTLPPGTYSLVVAPDSVARQVVARLTAVVPFNEITGHGPHDLPFEAPQSAVWREPDGREQPRLPDVWTFALAGPADVKIDLADGMTGDLRRVGEAAPVARVTGHYTGTLAAGPYQLDAASLGRNDRLAYTVGLSSAALQPGVPRQVTLPGTVGFAIAAPRVVSLTSFGSVPVKAVLRRADGSVVARVGARADDWNIAASRLLAAGAYTLDLAAASPPDLNRVSQRSGSMGDDSPSDDSDNKPSGEPEAQTALKPPADDAPASVADGDAPAPGTEVRLALPDARPVAPAPSTVATLTGAGVHVLRLEQPKPGQLLVAQAASSASAVLALERQFGESWQIVALAEGTAPVVASPADAGTEPWRVETWTVDGGAEPIRIAARAVDAAAQAEGAVSLAAVDGMPGPLAVARVGLDAATPLRVSGPAGMLAGGWGGQALAGLNGPLLPQGRDVWLLAPAPGVATVAALPMDGAQAMIVPPGQTASLAAAPSTAGHVAMWRADGGFGQPGLGAGAGIARFSAVARADAPVTLRNASGDGPLRVTLHRVELASLPARPLDAPLQTVLPPGTALPVTLPAGDKALQLDLGAGVAVFAEGAATWSGPAPLSRILAGAWTSVLLVNASAAAAPVSLAWQPAPAASLQPGAAIKRFFGAAGSFEIPFDAPAGAHLMVAGPAEITAIAADGAVLRGRDVAVSGAGRVIVTHEMGPVALWVAADGTSPWPEAAAQSVALPARLPLAGPAMALALNQPAASLLHVSTTAPVLAGLVQTGRTDAPRLFPAGAELHVMLAAGPAELRFYSPNDGPLTGSVAVSAEPVIPIAEGLGAAVSVAPGGSAAFGFSLAKAATIGVGVRADPDRARVRLLDATGAVKGEGVAQLRSLPAGQYVIEASVPPDAPPTVLRPAIIGITPRNAGPPPDVVQHYLELVGLKPQGTTP
jgi:uncharacterized protein YecT (DUF1311 family)